MNKLITTNNGGLPLVLDDLRWFLGQSASDAGIYQTLNGILTGIGDDFIISGCEISAGVMASGWIFMNNEILRVEGGSVSGSYFEKVTSYDSAGSKTFESGTVVDTYEKNRATPTGSVVTLGVEGDRMIDKLSYIDRGNVSTYDFTNRTTGTTILTFDNTWRDMDLSSIVTNSNASAVHIRSKIWVSGDAEFYLAETSSADKNSYILDPGNVIDSPSFSTGTEYHNEEIFIKLPSTQIIKYKGTPGSGGAISAYFTVAGWM